jgi:flagellar hook-basal body complex protein FliE
MSDFLPIGPAAFPPAVGAPGAIRPKPADVGADFSAILGSAIEEANELQTQAGEEVQKVMTGEIIDIHSAMIAVQKADVSFQMMMQVRNKLVTAYQEIMKMQV